MSQFAQMQREMDARNKRLANALERKPGLMLPRIIKALRAPPIGVEIGKYEGVLIISTRKF